MSRKKPIEGLDEVYKFLRTIPKELGNAATTVVNAMLGPVATEMKKQLTSMRVKRTGLLRKSLTKKTRRYRSGLVWGGVGPSKDAAGEFGKRKKRLALPRAYAHLVNAGTMPHEIKFKSRQRTMVHPGTKARPFRDLALQASKAQAVAKGEAELKKQVDKIIQKGQQ